MYNDSHEDVSVASRRLSFDGWLWIAFGTTVTCIAGLVLSDLLPPAVEQQVILVIMCLYGIVLLGGTTVIGIAMVRRFHRARWRFRVLSPLAAAFAVAVILAIAAAFDMRTAGLSATIILQVTTPFFVVLYGLPTRTFWNAAVRGAITACLCAIIYCVLYAFLFGFRGGYLVGNIGPGVKGLQNIPIFLFFCSIAVWPFLVVMLVGAFGGVVGRRLADQNKSVKRLD